MRFFTVIRVLPVITSLLLGTLLQAQQKPEYTQYILNNYILNPALTGIENYTDVKISHRHQWVGVQDAPITTYLTIHGPLGKKDDRETATSFHKPGYNPRGRDYWDDYTAARPHHGVGLQVLDDRTGPLSRFSAYATYAYHLGLSPRTSLALGFAAGISQLNLDRSKLFFDVPVDPAVYSSGELNKIKPDFGAGIWLYSADYFMGFSAQQIIPQKIAFTDKIAPHPGKLVPHLFGQAGYRFLLDEDFNLIPSVMVKYVDPLPLQFDFSAKLQYQDFLWIGANFRTYDGFSAMAGLNVSNTFNIGYSYDLTTSKLNTISKGTHEIIIGFLIGNKYGDWCPKNIW
ncbi:type IX secretion system membrane protein PorP/SprF [Flavitalea sp. BT771]|uniref:PorP/SprF family type IX secretion system membrane protein n=1 Tax=Flavitalea sp. BT771 TaxID=3063329 RepID=UPI0026E47ADB|nr:type IX secretion system membrane protein PorP/SprF [Flavitalea sp. BT771]MDO6431304.1 type IX secretion system membrane protein PorP/SprF [Flavitalea sp. BT771]MDV6220212.1 type IX secretion system membrane protein PorP/SprF [Flavitalea sp. BT771]